MTTTTHPPVIAAGAYGLDRAHSSATFEVEHAGLSSFRGSVSELDARLEAGKDGFVITGSAEVSSIDIDDDQIRPHLLSPDFFDAGRNPQIAFRSTSVEFEGADLRVSGELELAGQRREVEATGRLHGPVDLGHGPKLAVSLETTIDRRDFGMNWQMELPDGSPALANDVHIRVELELASS